MATGLFVSYAYSAAGGGQAFGSHILPNQAAPRSRGDVEALEARLRMAIRESKFTILNWIELPDAGESDMRATDINSDRTPDV